MVDSCVRQNMLITGTPVYEIIWVDNGSDDGVDLSDIATVCVNHKTNTGVSRGYNSGVRLCRGDVIVFPGTDQKLPLNWLPTLLKGFKGDTLKVKAKNGSCAFKKEVFTEYGHFREDFGLYGREEEEFGHRIGGKINIIEIPGAEHLGTEGAKEYDGKEDKDYWKMKNKETFDKKKLRLLDECIAKKEYYNPYA